MFRRIIVFLLLTLLTQFGGVVYLINGYLFKKWNFLNKLFSFAMLYTLALFIVVPLLAKLVDRVPLPAHNSEYIGPANYMTIALGRNYVKSDLYQAIINAAVKFGDKHPDAKITYLDAGFALSKYIPMYPHKSHNTGKSLDLGFIYKNAEGDVMKGSPSWTGYGIFTKEKLTKRQKKCLEENSLYDFTKYFGLGIGKGEYKLEGRLTQDLIKTIHREAKIKQIFIEPYLKASLGLSRFGKIKFHGCDAVRHDDHFHIEIE